MGELHEISVVLGELRAEVTTLNREMRDMKAELQSLRELRNKGWGVLAGAMLVAGIVGGKIAGAVGALFGVVR